MMLGGIRQARTWDGMESDTAEIEAQRRLFAARQRTLSASDSGMVAVDEKLMFDGSWETQSV